MKIYIVFHYKKQTDTNPWFSEGYPGLNEKDEP